MATPNQGYKDINYDRLAIWLKKGKRDEYKAAAAGCGLGYAEMIRLAIEEFIATHAGEVMAPAPPMARAVSDSLTADQRRLLATADNLPPNARKQLVKFLESLVTNAPASKEKDGD